MDLGFTNVEALLGGLGGWQQAGYPVATLTP
jgi:rhodanese-related sulfurtransferase